MRWGSGHWAEDRRSLLDHSRVTAQLAACPPAQIITHSRQNCNKKKVENNWGPRLPIQWPNRISLSARIVGSWNQLPEANSIRPQFQKESNSVSMDCQSTVSICLFLVDILGSRQLRPCVEFMCCWSPSQCFIEYNCYPASPLLGRQHWPSIVGRRSLGSKTLYKMQQLVDVFV